MLNAHNCSINYNDNLLHLGKTSIKIHFHDPAFIIPPRTETVIECSVSNPDIKEGLILDQKLSENLLIANCLVTVKKNNRINLSIINTSEKPITLKSDLNLKLSPLHSSDFPERSSVPINHINVSMDCHKRTEEVLKQLRVSHLNHEEKELLFQLCSEYSDIFHLPGESLTYTNALKHEIKTTTDVPIHVKSYRFPEIHKAEVRKQINKMLEQNIIEPSDSPWSSPIWVVPKKLDASNTQKWRVVIDYRKLNDITIGDTYPIPQITEILDQLGSSSYFSTLDLASGFHQIQLNEADKPKTAFTVPEGHFQFTRMPFGLKNAPSTFQRLMNSALSGLQGIRCFVYLDDVVSYGHDLNSCISNLKAIFQRIRDFNLKLQPDKCEFLRREVCYLGHIITEQGVKPNPEKVKAVTAFPIPKTPKDIKSFLGLVSYYRRFIPDFSKVAKALTSLLKKDTPFIWQNQQQLAFDTLKHKLTTAPLLIYPDFSKPFILTCDASNHAVGAVLSQGDVGKDQPIAFASRTLNKSECNYSTTEKELLSILYGCKTFRPYLYGRKFLIITDHRPLKWLFNHKDPSSKLQRWRLKLEEYDYEITYRKGKLNSAADALSRYPVNPVIPTNSSDQTNNSDSPGPSQRQTPPHSPAESNEPPFSPLTLEDLNVPLPVPSEGSDSMPCIDLLEGDNEIDLQYSPAEHSNPGASAATLHPNDNLPPSEPSFPNPETENHLPAQDPAQLSGPNPEIQPNLPVSTTPDPESSPTPENLPSPNSRHRNTPSPSAANSPVTDETYSKFLKSPTKSHDTLITEHNETLLKGTQKLIIVPTSIDMDESMPYVQEIVNNCPQPERDEFLQLDRTLNTFLPLTVQSKTYLFLFTKVHHFDDYSYSDIFKSLKYARDQIMMSYPTENEISTSDFKNPFDKHSFVKIYNMFKSNYNLECNNILEPLTVRYHDLVSEYSAISHLVDKRFRRGAWIGGIGSLAKTIFGTLNEDDGIKYDNAIQNVHDNEKRLASLIKENVLVTSSVLSQFNKTLHTIKLNEANLNQAIDDFSLKLKNITLISNELTIKTNINSILNSLEASLLTLSFRLEDITNAIMISNQNILHPAVLPPTQLYNEIVDNYRYLPVDFKLPVDLALSNIHVLLNVSSIVCYSLSNKIVFVLRIPLVSPRDVRNLGLMIDSTLSWTVHVAEDSRKVIACLRSLHRLKSFLSFKAKVLLMQSLVIPIIDYADACYSDLSEALTDKIDRLLNSCIRFFFGLRKYDHTSSYRSQLNSRIEFENTLTDNCIILFYLSLCSMYICMFID
ncbi:hypothetical protein ABMA27_001917 [Loxostege sticticalis]|uniref:Reverse transcriptase domain-containing protein n=1 Tax=Loxostege sticticalis TaxID=481309 RepID=A0ABR3HVV6_LOXSC